MYTFAAIMFLISLLIFIYFICRGIFKLIVGGGAKQSFKHGLISLAASILFLIVGSIANPVKNTASHQDRTAKTQASRASKVKSDDKSANTKQDSKSSSKIQASKSSQATKKHYDFSKIKLGMTKAQVIAILGEPTDQNSSTLYYGSADLDFDHDQLFDGSPSEIHKAANKKATADAKKASRKKANASQLKSFAKVFGQKDVETLQKNVGIAYSSTETSQGMAYGWKTNYGMLYRLDDSETGLTHVYKGGLGDDGTELYVGQTIKQKQRRSYYYY
ncbi:hypothetical protein KCA1_2039 [Lactiplantibacillus pentosus KCA1]|nr:hypothetical protein [Lactiplantibacillus pentosus]EIW13334.1 hypothetical protein KCA1_2039 [Lactiplantibacillus pentosus KCA1]